MAFDPALTGAVTTIHGQTVLYAANRGMTYDDVRQSGGAVHFPPGARPKG